MSEHRNVSRRPTRGSGGIVGALAAAICVGLLASPASAELLSATNNTNPQLAGAGVVVLDLSTAGGVQPALNFAVNAASRVMISFDAECAVGGATTTTYANIDIEIDAAPLGGGFVALAPTAGGDDAFCTSNGTGGVDGWVNPSRTVVTRVPAGVSAVRVRVNTVAGAGPTRIDDLSLVVSR